MKLKDFYYDLPEALIASKPLKNRTDSRLLCLNKSNGTFDHKKFTDILDYLQPDDLLVFNNTRVIPARAYGYKDTGGKIEILLERITDKNTAQVMVKSSKTLKPDAKLLFQDCEAKVLDKKEQFYTLKFNTDVLHFFETHGHIPLPPYMQRASDEYDKERYQTVYAKHDGAVAAPTAGLHFDNLLLEKIKAKKIQCAFVTLHVGAGTFLPVRAENIQDHKMHSEYYVLPEETLEKIESTKACGGRVIAVGTTSVRTLESAFKENRLKACQGETDIFIYPGYQFKVVDALITNFHLPESSLVMLVSAFSSLSIIKNAYQSAIEEKYRFFSYGDAMFIYK